jgi:hypothetical protein
LVNAVERNGKPIGIKVRVYRSILKQLLHVWLIYKIEN